MSTEGYASSDYKGGISIGKLQLLSAGMVLQELPSSSISKGKLVSLSSYTPQGSATNEAFSLRWSTYLILCREV